MSRLCMELRLPNLSSTFSVASRNEYFDFELGKALSFFGSGSFASQTAARLSIPKKKRLRRNLHKGRLVPMLLMS